MGGPGEGTRAPRCGWRVVRGRARASQHLSLLDSCWKNGLSMQTVCLELDWKSVIFLLKMDEKWISCMLSFANQDL